MNRKIKELHRKIESWRTIELVSQLYLIFIYEVLVGTAHCLFSKSHVRCFKLEEEH